MNKVASNSLTPSSVELSIVVPLCNEQASVGILLQSINRVFGECSQGKFWEVILVDDGSQDATISNASAASQSLTIPVTILEFSRNYGQTAAMQAGIDYAQGRFIVTMDGDLQNDPADIPMMLRHLQANDLDLLVGRREHRKDGLFLRLIPSWIANRLIAKVTGLSISDNGCSLKLFRAAVIKRISLIGEMHRFIPAWVAMHSPDTRIAEICVQHHARQFGVSKYGISRTIRVLLDLISVRFFMNYRARPSHFLGTAGLALGLLGTSLLLLAIVSNLFLASRLGFHLPMMLGAIAIATGSQLVGMGVLAEVVSRLYHDSNSHPSYMIRQLHHVGTQSSDQPDVASEHIIPFHEFSGRTADEQSPPVFPQTPGRRAA